MANYWERRAADDMFEYMEVAEAYARDIAKLYSKAYAYLDTKAKGIFDRYISTNRLTEAEARVLIASLRGNYTGTELINKLKLPSVFSAKAQTMLEEFQSSPYAARMAQIDEVMGVIDKVLAEITGREVWANVEAYEDIAKSAYLHSIYRIQQRSGTAFSFVDVRRKDIDTILHSKWSGMNFSDRIWRNTQAAACKAKECILLDFVTGRTEREASKDLADCMNVSIHNARRLIRTESCNVSTQMAKKSYKECGIKKYRYVAVLDLKTSELCREQDGKVYPVAEMKVGFNAPPLHPWCRSTTIAELSPEIMTRLTRMATDPVTGQRMKVPATMTYKEWYEKYVVGNERAEALEKGEKNKNSDRKQFEKFREILGNSVPGNLEAFQVMKYNDNKKWDLIRREYRTVSDILKKSWPDAFKTKAISMYYQYRQQGVELSSHAVARHLDRLKDRPKENIVELCKQNPNYRESLNGRFRDVVFKEGIAVIKNPDTGEVVTFVLRREAKKTWESI